MRPWARALKRCLLPSKLRTTCWRRRRYQHDTAATFTPEKAFERRWVYGYGTGARWKSPVGVLNLDVAYGQAVSQIRLHFSLGVTF